MAFLERTGACVHRLVPEPSGAVSEHLVWYDTQDLELDLWVFPDGSWQVKELELLPQRVAEGRWTEAEVAAIRAVGNCLVTRLDSARSSGWLGAGLTPNRYA